MTKALDLTGTTFGRLTVAWPVGLAGTRQLWWLCFCKCGSFTNAPANSLRGSRIKSCGCLRRETTRKQFTTHGLSKAPGWYSYWGAKERCTNKNSKSYKDYGGRGIKFKFTSFREFFNEVGVRPSPAHSLDRINNEGDYEIGNVRWATREEQNLNRRVKLIEQFSDSDLIKECQRRGIKISF